ncbi:MAG: sensor histidine kinase [Acidimicrobiia bacterium]|nr:sensor histidine kinase [Acidimicrobiia bacterium]
MTAAAREPTRLGRLGMALGQRLHERAFWTIQAAVLLISALHIALEAELIHLGLWDAMPGAHHIPVILYLAPVAYAGLVYGSEGGVLTGLWAGMLASVNVVIWSLDDYEWTLELVFVVVVVGMGIVMSLPVERERQQRQRAETTAHRLETLNELAAAALSARTPTEASRSVLAKLVDLTEFEDAGIVLWHHDQADPLVSSSYTDHSELSDAVERRGGDASAKLKAVGIIETSIATDKIHGYVYAKPTDAGMPEGEVTDFLTTVGNQLAIRVENALLVEQEQVMLSTYVKLVTEAQEEERRRLARDLHDGPAQHLAMLVRNLEGTSPASAGELSALHESAAGVLGELRRVARDQRPTLLDDLGLVPALEWLLAEANKPPGLATKLTVQGLADRLDPAVEVSLYRIVQEALRNAERHAEATRVDVVITFGGDRVSLAISDDGRGFTAPESPGEYVRAGRLGLMGMHERAQLVGASLVIRSGVDSGTTVTVEVPA